MKPVILTVTLMLLVEGYRPSVPLGYTLQVFQYEGQDPQNSRLALTQHFNAQGKLIFERYDQSYQDGVYHHFRGSARRNTYQDTMLVKSVGIERGDSTKVIYTYNANHQLAEWQSWQYAYKLKPGVDKGIGRPGGCELVAGDFEKNRTWQAQETAIYTYNNQGQRITCTLLHGTRLENITRWRYNGQGRVVQQASFASLNDTIPNSRWLRFYDVRGNLKKELYYNGTALQSEAHYTYITSKNTLVIRNDGLYNGGSGTLSDEYHEVRTKDTKGRTIKLVEYVGRCPLETITTTSYRPDGRLAQQVTFTCSDQRWMVHDYVYKQP